MQLGPTTLARVSGSHQGHTKNMASQAFGVEMLRVLPEIGHMLNQDKIFSPTLCQLMILMTVLGEIWTSSQRTYGFASHC